MAKAVLYFVRYKGQNKDGPYDSTTAFLLETLFNEITQQMSIVFSVWLHAWLKFKV